VVTLEVKLSKGSGLSVAGVQAGVAISRQQRPTGERHGRCGPERRVVRVASKGARGHVGATANERTRSGLLGSGRRRESRDVRAW
jgi:hypothetical protein